MIIFENIFYLKFSKAWISLTCLIWLECFYINVVFNWNNNWCKIKIWFISYKLIIWVLSFKTWTIFSKSDTISYLINIIHGIFILRFWKLGFTFHKWHKLINMLLYYYNGSIRSDIYHCINHFVFIYIWQLWILANINKLFTFKTNKNMPCKI